MDLGVIFQWVLKIFKYLSALLNEVIEAGKVGWKGRLEMYVYCL